MSFMPSSTIVAAGAVWTVVLEHASADCLSALDAYQCGFWCVFVLVRVVYWVISTFLEVKHIMFWGET